MHPLILRGSGKTGKLIIEELITRNHTVTAVVRNPDSVAPTTGLTIIQVTPLSTDNLTHTVEAMKADAIIVALASFRTRGSPFSKPTSSPPLMYDGHELLVCRCQIRGQGDCHDAGPRLESSSPNAFFLMLVVINDSSMNVGFKDHDVVCEFMNARQAVELTVSRLVMLAGGEKKDVKTWGDYGKGSGVMPSIIRTSVAGLLVDRLEEGGRQ